MSQKKEITTVFLDFCPFCGSGDIRLYYNNLSETWHVACMNCHGGLHDAESFQEAVRLWNGDEEE